MFSAAPVRRAARGFGEGTLLRFVRSHALQVGAVTAVLILIGVLVGLNVHGSGGGSPAAVGTTATAAVSPSPTADPRIAEVTAAAKNWIEAENRAYKTGSAEELNSLSVPDSQANGVAGIPRESVLHSHQTFVATRTEYTQLTIQVFSTSATADITYNVTGFRADWPSLVAIQPSKTVTGDHEMLSFQLLGGMWLVDSVR